jgi:hypothetical protein
MRPNGVYRRYEIGTEPAPDAVRLPPRFRVRVNKQRLIGLILRELVHTRGNLPVALSRPCVYGVFAGPVGASRRSRNAAWAACAARSSTHRWCRSTGTRNGTVWESYGRRED